MSKKKNPQNDLKFNPANVKHWEFGEKKGEFLLINSTLLSS